MKFLCRVASFTTSGKMIEKTFTNLSLLQALFDQKFLKSELNETLFNRKITKVNSTKLVLIEKSNKGTVRTSL